MAGLCLVFADGATMIVPSVFCFLISFPAFILPAFSGHGIGMHGGFFEYRIQNADEIVAVLPGHPETGSMVFPERTVFINGEAPPVIAVIAIHVIMAEILVMPRII